MRAVEYELPSFDTQLHDVDLAEVARARVEIRHVRGASDTTYLINAFGEELLMQLVEPSLGQQLLDIAVAQGEAEIKPDRVLDDLGREAVAAVTERSHADILPDTPLTLDPVSVTMPSKPIQARGNCAAAVSSVEEARSTKADLMSSTSDSDFSSSPISEFRAAVFTRISSSSLSWSA